MSFWKILGSGDVWGAVKKLFALIEGNPVLADWISQFEGAAESTALSDAATYAPQVFAGTLSITDAIAKLGADLLAKGLTLSETLVGNAIRTHLNALQTAPAVTPQAS